MKGPWGCFLRAMTAREPGARASLPEQIEGLSSWAAATLAWPVITHRWSANSEGGRRQAGGVCEWGMDPQQSPSTHQGQSTTASGGRELGKAQVAPAAATVHPRPPSTIPDCLQALLPLPSDCDLIQSHHL